MLATLSAYPTPANPDEFPTRRSGKNIRRNKKAPSTMHTNNCASALSLKGSVRNLWMLPAPALGCSVTGFWDTPKGPAVLPDDIAAASMLLHEHTFDVM